MLMTSVFRSIRDNIQFISPIPKQQLVRRLVLLARRKIEASIIKSTPLSFNQESEISRVDWALPHLRAPHGTLEKSESIWRATFLYTTRDLGQQIEWSNKNDNASTQLWRMNLHYFEYLPSLDRKSAEFLIVDWISQCRPYEKNSANAAWNAYTISLRISAWLDYYSINKQFFSESFEKQFSASLIEQANFLVTHIESDIRGNHIIKNIRALYEAAYAFNFNSTADKWCKVADYWLETQLRIQILKDGVHFERSLSYHSQVFADFLTIYTIKPEDALKKELGQKLDLMAQPIVDLCHPDDKVVQFNDSGLNMAVAPSECLKVYSQFRNRKITPQSNFQYVDAGYYGFRSQELYVVIKMGPLGPDELMAHAHGDWGSFECSAFGQRLFVDQGVFEYISGKKRDLCRSTYSHNTAVLASQEQARFIGAFRCARRPKPDLPNYQALENGFQVSGILTLTDPQNGNAITLDRTFILNNQCLTIENSNTTLHLLEDGLLVHPDWRLEQNAPRESVITHRILNHAITVNCIDSELMAEKSTWWPNMGQTLETLRLRSKTSAGKLTTKINFQQFSTI